MDIKKILASFLSASFCIFSAFSYANASDESQLLLGDADLNGIIDSVDASLILGEYSASSTGGTSTLNSTQKKCADVDRNSTIDSVDASHVLAYYAYISTGGKSNIVDFLDGEYEPAATTTTKQPETTTTQAPVIEEPEYREYTLEDIRTNYGAFELYAQYLTNDLMAGNAMSMSYTNYTSGGREAVLFLAMLNEGYISDDVLGEVFADYSEEELKSYTEFIYSIADIQEKFGTDVDFSKYTLNPEIGTYINDIDNAYRNGEIEDFLYNAYMNGNMVEGGWGHPAIESMLCSYDTNNIYGTGQDLNVVFMDSYIENLYERIEKSKGISYTR